MRKKIFYSLFLLTFTVLFFATALFLWISYRQVTEVNVQSLKNQAQILLALDEQGKLDYENLFHAKIEDRLTVLSAGGRVLFDNYANAQQMDVPVYTKTVTSLIGWPLIFHSLNS